MHWIPHKSGCDFLSLSAHPPSRALWGRAHWPASVIALLSDSGSSHHYKSGHQAGLKGTFGYHTDKPPFSSSKNNFTRKREAYRRGRLKKHDEGWWYYFAIFLLLLIINRLLCYRNGLSSRRYVMGVAAPPLHWGYWYQHCFSLGTTPTRAAWLQVHRGRVLRQDQRRVSVPAGPVPQVMTSTFRGCTSTERTELGYSWSI